MFRLTWPSWTTRAAGTGTCEGVGAGTVVGCGDGVVVGASDGVALRLGDGAVGDDGEDVAVGIEDAIGVGVDAQATRRRPVTIDVATRVREVRIPVLRKVCARETFGPYRRGVPAECRLADN